MSEKNLLVIGGGPGGYTAAFLAADLGMKVTLVDANPKPGGVCLHRGCIPSKALLHVAKLISETKQAKQWGIEFPEPIIHLDKLRDWKNQVIGKMAGGLTTLTKKRGIRHVTGRAVYKNSNSVIVDNNEIIEFDYSILASGSSPMMPGDFGTKSSLLMDSTSALDIADIPDRLLVIGGGYIGLEMGTFYSALGSKVTVVEMMDGLLPGVDIDLVRPLFLKLRRDFEKIYLNTKVTSLKIVDNGVTVVLEGGAEPEEQRFNRVLVSVGRSPNSSGLGLENTKVKIDADGFVKADSFQKTDDPSIFAIGDVIGGAMLAHKASREAKVAVEVLCGEASEFDNRAVPAVVFTDPEIAWAGFSETEAKATGKKVVTASFPWGASGRASTLGRNEGITKLIVEPKTDKILGVGMVGAGAGELIAEGVLAIEMGMTAQDMAGAIHPHPTLSETLMEAAELFLGRPTHVFKK
jgi:dihydrolipoamide dehydrogenase